MSDTASNTPDPAAEDAQDISSAMAAAVSQMEIEVWTLYSVGVCVTILRTYARLKSVGLRNLRADDFLVWGAVVSEDGSCSKGVTTVYQDVALLFCSNSACA